MLKKLTTPSAPSLWKSKNPHSLEYLRYLQGVLVKNDTITENNKALVIEAVRAITEILIWGDQNDAAVFDFFLERQMFTHFLRIMQQTNATYVNVQLLQTLNILFENLRNETSLYFLLSNNHVNSIITHGFDFANEEITAYYISFLKTLSFKLNAKTIHFFFNESTDEFPLFTEAVKFYKHSESMVRIAVRTLTLNIFRVKEEMLSKFVVQHSHEYLNNVCHEIAVQIIEMDTFARSAQNEQSNRARLMILMDVHIDNLHYLNDILCIKNEELNNLVIDSLNRYLIGPIYLSSLASIRTHSQTVLVSRVSALFLFAQFFRIIHEKQTVQTVLTTLFFGDQNEICRTEWSRSLDQGLHLKPISVSEKAQESFLFRSSLFAALHDGHDDHACFFAFLLIYCIFQNPGVQKEFFNAAQLPFPTSTSQCDPELAENLVRIVENCSLIDTPIRPITLELCCVILRHILVCLDNDQAPLCSTSIESAVRRTQHKLATVLKGAIQTEKLFLEMFEDEYYQLQKNELKLANLLEDPSLYLPPSNTPLSGIPLFKRIPSGNDERIRRTLQFYFMTRRFGQDLSGESEQLLPLSSRIQPMAELNDCINLNNSDLLSCTVVTDRNERMSRFLVTDQFQFILVEPDNRRLGWAIVRFVGLLQDIQITGTSESRALHIVVEDVKTRAQSNSKPLLSAKLIFDDHIRCMAAKQRLNRGRKHSRAHKLSLIAELLGIRLIQQQQQDGLNSVSPASPLLGTGIGASPQRTRGSAPGTVQKIFAEIIPPDPDTTATSSNNNTSHTTGNIHHI